ncbi:MAG: Hsp20/alpha crystallin family protein [Oscillospiraceae bacterium]
MFSIVPYTRRDNNIFRLMDDMERSFFNNAVSGSAQFRCDISEKDGAYLLEAELPGFKKEDIHVDIEGETLTVSASSKVENDEKDKDGNYIRRERRYGSFSRSFDVTDIDTSAIKAAYNNGVLELTLPKAQKQLPTAQKISIE